MDGKKKTELPQNLDAEASLLGAILIDGDVIIKIAERYQPMTFLTHVINEFISNNESL